MNEKKRQINKHFWKVQTKRKGYCSRFYSVKKDGKICKIDE